MLVRTRTALMSKPILHLFIVLFGVLCGISQALAVIYEFTVLDGGGDFNPPSIDAKNFNPNSLNNHSVVVGTYNDATQNHGFLYERGGIYGHRGGTYTSINFPGAPETGATGINDSGQVVGWYTDPATSRNRGYLYSAGTFTSIHVPGATWTVVWGINASGQMVGTYVDAGGVHGFLYSEGTFTLLVVPGGTATSAVAINASGQIVGQYQDATGTLHGYLYSATTFVSLDIPGSNHTILYGINDLGEVVGQYGDGTPGPKSFLYRSGTYTQFSNPQAFYTVATGINNVGEIVGQTIDDTGQHGFLARPIRGASPVCSAAQAFPAVLGSPNHQFIPIVVTGVTDPDGDVVTITVTNVTQDEPVDEKDDSNTSPDAIIQSGAASVRAERSVKGNGRVYKLSFMAEDNKGSSCTGAVNVSVPHSLKKGLTAIDDGQVYDSTTGKGSHSQRPQERKGRDDRH